MFLINSSLAVDIAALPVGEGHPFFRSYGVNLPSSLERVLSSALVYSTRLPESVCGTVTYNTRYEVFLGSVESFTLRPYGLVITSRLNDPADLPTRSAYRLKPGYPTPG